MRARLTHVPVTEFDYDFDFDTDDDVVADDDNATDAEDDVVPG